MQMDNTRGHIKVKMCKLSGKSLTVEIVSGEQKGVKLPSTSCLVLKGLLNTDRLHVMVVTLFVLSPDWSQLRKSRRCGDFVGNGDREMKGVLLCLPLASCSFIQGQEIFFINWAYFQSGEKHLGGQICREVRHRWSTSSIMTGLML